MRYTTSDLLEDIKTQAMIPTNQSTFSQANLLAMADRELRRGLLPHIMSVREDYFTDFKDYPIDPDTDKYPIPPRAIGNKLRDLTIVNTNNPKSSPRSLAYLSKSEIPSHFNDKYEGFYFRGNHVIVHPTQTSRSESLRMFYFSRPNKLVLPIACGRINGVDSANTQITVDSLPSTFLVGEKVDLVKGEASFENLAEDVEITAINDNTVTLSSLPEELAEADFLCLAGEAPVVQLPPDYLPVLIQRVVIKALEALGDRQGMQAAQAELEKMEAEIGNLISPRIEGESKKIRGLDSPLRYMSSNPRYRGF